MVSRSASVSVFRFNDSTNSLISPKTASCAVTTSVLVAASASTRTGCSRRRSLDRASYREVSNRAICVASLAASCSIRRGGMSVGSKTSSSRTNASIDLTWAASPRTHRLLVGVMTSMVGGAIIRPSPTSTVVSIMVRSGARISEALACRIVIIRLTGVGGSSRLASDRERSKACTDFVDPITSKTPAAASTETSGFGRSPAARRLACRSNAAIVRSNKTVASLVPRGITRYVTSPGCGRSKVVNRVSMVAN